MAKNKATLTDPARLEGALVRRSGEIVEQPTSPAGGKAVGDSPAQAAQRGTAAQKKPVIEKAVSRPTEQTGIKARALGTEGQAAAEGKQEEASKLGQFQNFNERVKAIVERKFAGVGAKDEEGGYEKKAKATVKEDILNQSVDENFQWTEDVDGQQVVRTAEETLQAYIDSAAAGQPDESLLVPLSNALNAKVENPNDYVKPDDIADWVGTGPEALGESAAFFLEDNILMSDMTAEDYSALGFQGTVGEDGTEISGADEVAGLLGISAADMNSLTLSEFRDVIEERRQEIFDEVNGLRQEMANAVPGSDHAKQLQQRIADLTGAGVATSEQRMAELVEEVDLANQIEIGGQMMTIENMLDDQNITDMVVDWVNATSEERKTMFADTAGYQAFETWMTENEELLQGLAESMGKTAEVFGEAQDIYSKLGIGLDSGIDMNEELLAGLLGEFAGQSLGTMTSEQINKIQEDFQNTGVYQIFNTKGKEALAGDITAEDLPSLTQFNVEGDPEATAEAIEKAWATSRTIKDDMFASDWMGDVDKFMTAEDIASYEAQLPVITAAKNLPPSAGKSLADSTEFKQLVKDGSISAEEVAEFGKIPYGTGGASVLSNSEVIAALKNPKERNYLLKAGKIKEVPAALEAKAAMQEDIDLMANAENANDILAAIFEDASDDSVNVSNFNRRYKEAITGRKLGDPAANSVYMSLLKLDANQDGQITNDDIRSIQKNNFTNGSLMDWLTGAIKTPAIKEYAQTNKARMTSLPASSSPAYTAIANKLSGGIDQWEAWDIWNSSGSDKLSTKALAKLPWNMRDKDGADRFAGKEIVARDKMRDKMNEVGMNGTEWKNFETGNSAWFKHNISEETYGKFRELAEEMNNIATASNSPKDKAAAERIIAMVNRAYTSLVTDGVGVDYATPGPGATGSLAIGDQSSQVTANRLQPPPGHPKIDPPNILQLPSVNDITIPVITAADEDFNAVGIKPWWEE